MIAVYLQTEVNSTRFRTDIEAFAHQQRIDPRMIHVPDWRNAQEIALRRAILGMHRGYGRNEGYFMGFPADVRWERITLTRAELERVRYIEYDYWVELSGGSRLASTRRRGAHDPGGDTRR